MLTEQASDLVDASTIDRGGRHAIAAVDRPMTSEAGRRAVLVVDDEENIRFLVASALDMAGFDVATAATGQDALELGGTPSTRT